MNRSGEKTFFSVREWIIRGGFPIDSVMTQIESSLSLRQASAFTFFFFSFHFHVVFFHSSPLSLAFAFFFICAPQHLPFPFLLSLHLIPRAAQSRSRFSGFGLSLERFFFSFSRFNYADQICCRVEPSEKSL